MPTKAQNGRLDRSTLVQIRPGLLLRADAAASFARMNVAFRKRFGRDIGVTDAYRDFAQQEDVKRRKGNLAAKPGTSNHGWGIALDLATNINVHTSEEHAWMDAYASRYGWINPLWARDNNPSNGAFEPWHWEYVPQLDTYAGGANVARPTAIEEMENDMFIIANQVKGHRQNGTAWVVIPQGTGQPRATTLYGDPIEGLPLLRITDARSWAGVERSIQWA